MTLYAILRHGKINSTTKGAASSHNHRLGAKTDPLYKKINPNVIHKYTRLNRYSNGIYSPSNKPLHNIVNDINSRLPAKRRKDAVEAVELILTASPEFFLSMGKDRDEQAKHPEFNDWCKKTVAWAKNEFGKNIIDISLHMDEASPHFHVLTIPFTDDGRLCAKEITRKGEMKRRHTEYAKAMVQFGLERGEDADITGAVHTSLKTDRREVLQGIEVPDMPALSTGFMNHANDAKNIRVYAENLRKQLIPALREKSKVIEMTKNLLEKTKKMSVREKFLKAKELSLASSEDAINRIAKDLGVKPNEIAERIRKFEQDRQDAKLLNPACSAKNLDEIANKILA
jgi:hypothetical protein